MRDQQLLTGEAARILSVSSEAVRNMERAGKLTAKRVGKMRLFDRREVEQLATARERKTTAAAYK